MSELKESRSWERPETESEAEALIRELRRELDRLKEKVAAFREAGAGDRTSRPD